MKYYHVTLLFLIVSFIVSCNLNVASEKTLKDVFKDKFHIGVALSLDQIDGKDSLSLKIVESHFSSIVAEDCMKSMYVQPLEGEFNFSEADRFVALGEQNNMHIVGHALIWHSQAPKWFFIDEKGDNVSREVLIERMRRHITSLVKHYKGAVKGWDVVNEAILEDGSYRNSKFYEIIGEDFIPLAFQFAHEADPNVELYYNDYNEWYEGKRNAIVKMIQTFKERGIRIDGVGMQGHMDMDSPSLDEYEAAIEAYANAGVKVMITEWDISALPSPWGQTSANITDTIAYRKEMNPYTAGLPQDVEEAWEKRYLDFFKLFLKHQDKIDRVTLWGVTDNDSWKNDFPVHGRMDYPLLFDRNHQAKPIVHKLIQMVGE